MEEISKIELKSVTEKSQKNTFEDILDVIGHFRFYQIIVFVVLELPEYACSMTILSFIFVHANPGWKCTQYSTNDWNSSSIGGNQSTAFFPSAIDGNGSYDNEMNGEWSKDDTNCYMNNSVCTRFLFSPQLSSIVTEWNLVCQDSYKPKLAVSAQFVGVLLGVPLFGYLSDTFGRRWPGIVGSTLMMLLHAASGLANTFIFYLLIRFLVGFSAGSILAIYFVYRQEFTGPSWRVFMGNVGLFGWGHATLGLVAYLIRDWRTMTYIIGLTHLLQIPLLLFIVPESPRWLIQKGRLPAAMRVIRQIAKYNRRPMPDASLIQSIKCQDRGNVRYGYYHLYKYPSLRTRTLALALIWFTVAEIYYGVMLQVNTLGGDIYLNNTLAALIAYPVCWLSIPIFNRISRRVALVSILSVTTVLLFSLVTLSSTGVLVKASLSVTIIAIAAKALSSALWNLNMVFTVEQYPTLIRNIGYSHSNAVCRIASVLAPQIALLGVAVHWVTPYIIHCLLALTSGIIAMTCLSDTHHKPLTESFTDSPLQESEKKCLTDAI